MSDVESYKYDLLVVVFFFFFQAEDGIRDYKVTGVQTCALPISLLPRRSGGSRYRLWSCVVLRAEQRSCERSACRFDSFRAAHAASAFGPHRDEIGRASCRERV